MSTFKGLLKELNGVSIDRFTPKHWKSEVFFLSHCHADHMVGLDKNFVNHLKSNPKKIIYMSEVSSVLIKNILPGISEFVRALSTNEPHHIIIPESYESARSYNVTLLSAGHCPGSVMFLFEDSNDIRILYTGDFRLTNRELKLFKALHNSDGSPKEIHKMYFDSTFWSEKYANFPDRNESCDIVISIIKEWISKGDKHVVFLRIPANYGSEFLFMEIYEKLKMPIFVNHYFHQAYKILVDMDGSITTKASDTQIYCGKKKYNHFYNENDFKIRTVFPSAMRWTHFNTKIFDEERKNNIFYVCYSSHCSFNELKSFLDYLKPESIEPCVVPENEPEDFYESINEYCKKFLKTPCKYLKQNKNDEFVETKSELDDAIYASSSSDSENEAVIKSKSNISELISNNVVIDAVELSKCKKIKFF